MKKEQDPIPAVSLEAPYDPYNIVFSYMIFQGNPKHNAVYYWLDDSSSKHKMMQDVFLNLVRKVNDNLVHSAYEYSNTYSFYIWDKEANTITHLTPNAQASQYSDSIQRVVQGKDKPKKIGDNRSSKTQEEIIAGFGFNVPSEKTVGNMQMSIINNKPDKEDRFEMLRNILSGRR